MAKNVPVVPEKIEDFNKYQGLAVPYLKLNETRLMIDSIDFLALDKLVNDPATGWVYWHAKHSDPNTKSEPGNKDLVKSRKAITKQLQYIYRNIPRKVMITLDYVTLNIAEYNSHKSKKGNNTSTPFGKISSKSGAIIDFDVREDTETTSKKMPDLADAIRAYCAILKPGDPLPTNTSECAITVISTKGKFSHQCPLEEAGNRFASYLQYVNLKDASKDGPISGLLVCIIAL